MRPELIRFSDTFVIHGYPAMLALAFLTCTLGASYESQRQHPPFFIPPRAGVWAFLGALLGAKVFWILQYASWRDLAHAFRIWESGLVFYGGLIGGGIAIAIYFRVVKVPLIRGLDVGAPYLALGEAITRIGCFLNGCCWGSVCHVPWGVTFPIGSLAYEQQRMDGLIGHTAEHALPVHPTQLYMVLGLVIAFFIMRGALGRTRPGVPMMLYFVSYGLVRFTVEIFRGDSARSIAGMTVSQAISLTLLVVGAAGIVFLKLRQKDTPPPVMAEPEKPEAAQMPDHS
jgi:phosphatidylglycerol:prolipoprotein diacylglycerol transferase